MPGSLCPGTQDIVTWKMFASLISKKQCVALIFIYLVANEVKHFLIFLFISFISSFMNWHFVFFLILFIMFHIFLLSTPYWQDFGSARNFFQGYFSPFSLSSFTLDMVTEQHIFVLSYKYNRKSTLKQKALDISASSCIFSTSV